MTRESGSRPRIDSITGESRGLSELVTSLLGGGLDEPASACDDGIIGTELVEVVGDGEEGATRALRIKAQALDRQYERKYKCGDCYCDDADGSKCYFRAAWAGPAKFEPLGDIKLEGDGKKPKTLKGQVLGTRRRVFGCFCSQLV